jgi:hypothetical protein
METDKDNDNKKSRTDDNKPNAPTTPAEVEHDKVYHRCFTFNCVLSFCNNYLKDIDIRKFGLYQMLHTLFIWLIGFIMLFDCNIIHLIILLMIVSLDAISVVILHECPLSILERKHTGTCLCDVRTFMLKRSGISYHCDHEYEKQIELLINVWTLISGKCLALIFFNFVNIKLINYNNLYLSQYV